MTFCTLFYFAILIYSNLYKCVCVLVHGMLHVWWDCTCTLSLLCSLVLIIFAHRNMPWQNQWISPKLIWKQKIQLFSQLGTGSLYPQVDYLRSVDFLGPSSFFETDDRKVQKTLLWSFIPAKLWEGLLMLRISPGSFTLMGLYGVSPDTLLHLGLV